MLTPAATAARIASRPEWIVGAVADVLEHVLVASGRAPGRSSWRPRRPSGCRSWCCGPSTGPCSGSRCRPWRGCPRAPWSRCCAGSPSRSSGVRASGAGVASGALRLAPARASCGCDPRSAWSSRAQTRRAMHRARSVAGAARRRTAGSAAVASSSRLPTMRGRASGAVVEQLLELVSMSARFSSTTRISLEPVARSARTPSRLQRPGHADLVEPQAEPRAPRPRRCRGRRAPGAGRGRTCRR